MEQGYSEMPAANDIGAIVNMEPEHKLIRSILQNSNLFPPEKLRSSASLMAHMPPEGTVIKSSLSAAQEGHPWPDVEPLQISLFVESDRSSWEMGSSAAQ